MYPEKTDIGFTVDVEQRFKRHNAGTVLSTSDFKPWKLIAYVALESEEKAKELEKYFKVGSGHAFAQKRLWS
jgi:predicted GIY-YIG superfamily endonuclease